MEEQDHSPDQDMILSPDMIPAPNQDLIDLHILVEDEQNWQIVIDCKRNQVPSTLPLWMSRWQLKTY